MSAWGKFLPSITVPTGGWAFVVSTGGGPETATIPAGEYTNIYTLLSCLVGELSDLECVSSAAATVSDYGLVTITVRNFWGECVPFGGPCVVSTDCCSNLCIGGTCLELVD